jgi:PAS domain S-box-containing protein
VLEAATGHETLRLAASHPDLIILDVNLPDLSGFDVCRRLKAAPETSAIVVVHTSATYVRGSDRAHGLDGGADGYLTTPVEPPELIATVKALLRLREAEQRLRASLQEWQTTFDALGDGVALLDPDGRVVRCNRALARLVGRPAAEVAGSHFTRLVPGAKPACTGIFDEARRAGSRFADEVRVDGRWLRVAVDPVLGPAGKPGGAVWIMSDVTAAKRAEQEREELLHREQAARADAQAAIAAREAFFARASHELRTPLTSALGTVRLLDRALEGRLEERPAELLAIARRNLDTMLALVNDLLDASRLGSGRDQLSLGRVRVRELIDESADLLAVEARDRQVTLRVSAPETLTVHGDRFKLEQVLVNLLANALKFTAAGGTVVVDADVQAAGRVRIRVTDTGIGIAGDDLQRIFEPFYRGARESGRRQRGTGLGLAICRQITALHGGTIHAESAGPGRGARFVVELPAGGDAA